LWHTMNRKSIEGGELMKSPINQTCIICSQERAEGLRICTQWICTECETEIVRTDVKDPKYPFFIHQLKQISYKRDA
jgi:hypothetical protein